MYGPGRSLADHGARVPEVLPAAELEGFLLLLLALPMSVVEEQAKELGVGAAGENTVLGTPVSIFLPTKLFP